MQVNLKKERNVIAAAALFVAGLSAVQAAIYPAPANTGRPSAAFPAEFFAFEPPVAEGTAANVPAIAEWTRVNEPGDTLALTGSRLSVLSGTDAGRDTQFRVFGQSGSTKMEGDAAIQRLDGMQAAITLPNTLPANTMYFLWTRNNNGFSEPVGINQTESWWATDRAVKDGTISIYGRNLQLGSGKAYVYIEELNQWLTSTQANPYKAEFKLPATIANGTYTLWAHNGHGREYGWANALKIAVETAVNWTAGNTLNVKNAPFNAKGDGSADDYGAIQQAIDSAGAGDTVYLPAGTYKIGDNIRRLSGKRLLGAGMEQTKITTHSAFANATYAEMFYIDRSADFAMGEMTLDAGAYPKGKVFRGRDMDNGTIENVRFTQVGSTVSADLVDISNSKYIRFKGCEFYPCRNVFVGNTKQVGFYECDWYGLFDCNVLLSSWGANELSIEKCSAQHYDDSDPTDGSGWCQGRFLWGSGHGGTHRNLYFGNNSINNMHPRFDPRFDKYNQNGRMNTGEHVMFEWTATFHDGKPTAVDGNTLTFSNITKDVSNTIIVIIDGEGVGQSRRVSAYDEATGKVTVDEPWRVQPNTGSTVVMGRYVNRMAVYDNFFDGHERLMDPLDSGALATNRTATTAVSVYGAFQDLVVAENTIQQTRQGIISWGFGYNYIDPELNNLQPNYFNLFTKNTMNDCFQGIRNTTDTFNSYANSPGTIIAFNVWRKNAMTNISFEAVSYDSKYVDLPIGMTVYDHNSAVDFGVSVGRSENLRNQVWVGNSFTGDGGDTAISFEADHTPMLSENSWNNFATTYGAGPGAVLELPARVITLCPIANSCSVEIRNAGTETLNWTASSADSWLKLGQTSGNTAAEKASSLALSLNTQPTTDMEAVITVSGAGQTRKMTVLFDLDSSGPLPPTNPPTPVLNAIAITGPTEINEGASANYTCTATYSDGSHSAVSAMWSENSDKASIGGNGTLTAALVDADTPVVLTANFGGKTAMFGVTIKNVPAATLTAIQISGPVSVSEGATAQFSCTASYSDGSSATVSPTWSENSAAASISTSGLLTAGAVSADTAVIITAQFGGITDTHSVTVTDVPSTVTLTGILIDGPASVTEGTTGQFKCTARYSDGSSATVSPVWSDNSPNAYIGNNGTFSASQVSADEIVTVTAQYGGITETRSVTIVNIAAVSLSSISISGPASLNEGASGQYSCTAHYSDGSSQPVVPDWAVNSAVAAIDTAGLLTAGNVAANTPIIVSANYGGKSADFNVTVIYVMPTLTGLTVSGPAVLEAGNSGQYTCTAGYSDGSTALVAASWSENSAAASINTASGLLNTAGVTASETLSVTASFGGMSASKSVIINYPVKTLTTISISGPALANENALAQFVCYAHYSDGSSEEVRPVWSVDNTIGYIGANGTLQTGDVDVTTEFTVTAVYEGLVANHNVTIKVVGTNIVYPLSGFAGKTVKAELWDETAQQWHDLGTIDSPEELVIENVNAGQWYWITIKEWNGDTGEWEQVHANWVSM